MAKNTRARYLPALGALLILSFSAGYAANSASRLIDSPKTIASPPRSNESVREELIRLRKQTGLSLLTVENDEIRSVDFSRRGLTKLGDTSGSGAISHDGTKIAFGYSTGALPIYFGLSRLDGSDIQLFPNFDMPGHMCWSYDDSIVAMFSNNRSGGAKSYGLQMWRLKSETTQATSEPGSQTSQCWSPDDKQIIYEAGGVIKVYDTEKNSSRNLGQGEEPSWSPDGVWIAFRDHDVYLVVRPDGQGKKKLFRRKGASSALWWSPDSRMVAYVSIANIFGGGLTLDVENYRLRVRRLADNSDDWVANVGGGEEFQWVVNRDLLRLINLQAARK
jgi:hypothetical protein